MRPALPWLALAAATQLAGCGGLVGLDDFSPGTKCGSNWVDLKTSPSHCGECNNSCGSKKSCVDGLCKDASGGQGGSGGKGGSAGKAGSSACEDGECAGSPGQTCSPGCDGVCSLGKCCEVTKDSSSFSRSSTSSLGPRALVSTILYEAQDKLVHAYDMRPTGGYLGKFSIDPGNKTSNTIVGVQATGTYLLLLVSDGSNCTANGLAVWVYETGAPSGPELIGSYPVKLGSPGLSMQIFGNTLLIHGTSCTASSAKVTLVFSFDPGGLSLKKSLAQGNLGGSVLVNGLLFSPGGKVIEVSTGESRDLGTTCERLAASDGRVFCYENDRPAEINAFPAENLENSTSGIPLAISGNKGVLLGVKDGLAYYLDRLVQAGSSDQDAVMVYGVDLAGQQLVKQGSFELNSSFHAYDSFSSEEGIASHAPQAQGLPFVFFPYAKCSLQ